MPKWDVHVYVHGDVDRLNEKLDDILGAVRVSATQTKERVMAVSAEVKAFSERFDAASNEIASDLQALRDKIAAGQQLSQEDKDVLNAAVSRLEVMGRDPENPVPEAPPA